MPTDKPRVTFAIDKEKLSKLESYRYNNKIKNQTQAILSLIDKGLDALAAEDSEVATAIKSASLHSSKAEKQLISLHRTLNHEGQEKLLDYADDLVASGKYIKSDPDQMGKAKDA